MILIGVKKNKTTIYYMRNELVTTFTDTTRLVNMVETRKLRNFLKTFFKSQMHTYPVLRMGVETKKPAND